jgi:HemY protein
MTRLLWLGFRLALLMLLAVFLSEHPGKAVINWQNYRIETSVGALILLMLIALAVATALSRILRDLLRLPDRWRGYRYAQTSKKGRKALVSGLVAVASGDAVTAQRLARQSEATIVDPVLSHLLTAEAMILAGDNDAAESQFELLLGRDDTRVIGHRGLIEVALAQGDWLKALARARRARSAMPRSLWLLGLLIDLSVRAGDWDEARQLLEQAVRARVLTGPEARRRQLALYTGLGLRAEQVADDKAALALAEKALSEDAGFIPAALLAARLNVHADRAKTAERILERAWQAHPHADLATAWRLLVPTSDPVQRLAWIDRLRQAQPGQRAGRLAYAEAAIDGRHWALARGELETLLAEQPSAAVYQALARLEQAEKADLNGALHWYKTALGLPPEKPYACQACGCGQNSWQAICPDCEAFAQIEDAALAHAQPGLRAPHVSLPGIGTPLTMATMASALPA